MTVKLLVGRLPLLGILMLLTLSGSGAYSAPRCDSILRSDDNRLVYKKTTEHKELADPELAKQLNRRMFMRNLSLSRTASLGLSSKKFEVAPEEVRIKALENSSKAFEMIYTLAKRKVTGTELFNFMVKLNRVYNQGLLTTTGDGSTKAAGGEFRRYTLYSESDRGITPEQLPKRLPELLKQLADEIARKLGDPTVDPIELAAWAHDKFAADIKPFHDANGRTARALVDLILLNQNLPLPWYFGEASMAEGSGELKGEYSSSIKEHGFKTYLMNSIKRSQNFIESDQVDLDLSSMTEFEKNGLRQVQNIKESISKIRLANGKIVFVGKNLGSGAAATVYCLGAGCKFVVKIPLNRAGLDSLPDERLRADLLFSSGIPVAKIMQTPHACAYLIKEHVEGVSAVQLRDAGKLNKEHLAEFAKLYKYMQRTGVAIDVDGTNLIWVEKQKQFVLIDTGEWPQYSEWHRTLDAWDYYYFKNDPTNFQLFKKMIETPTN